ncbi:MAG: aminotransferase class IV [Planctomycetaceae bacterium]
MTEPVAWINGRLRAWSDAAVPAWDLGVVAGAAVTEAGRTYGHRFLRQSEHFRRFFSGLQTLQFPQPFSQEQLHGAVQEVLSHNTGLISPDADLGVVICSTAGSNATYLGHHSDECTTMVHTYPLPFSLWQPAFLNGVRLRTVRTRQIPADCFPTTVKVRNRLHWWLADREAAALEAGSRALLLDSSGSVTETSTCCVLMVRDGMISTPSGEVLDSLSGRVVEECATKLGIPFRREPISVAELQLADEVILSSAPAGLLPVRTIDGVTVRDEGSLRGPVFVQLLETISQDVGVDLQAQLLRG